MKGRPKKLIFAIVAFILIVGIIGFSSIAKSKDEANSNNAKATEEQASTTAAATEKEEQAVTTEQETDNTGEEQAVTAPATENTSTAQTGQTAAVVATQPETKQPAASTNSSTSAAQAAQPSQPPANVAGSQPATTSPAPAATTSQVPEQTVKITIIGPNDRGTILGVKDVSIKEGNTVLDVLVNAIGKSNVDYSGSGATAYVSGIQNIYEFDYGPKSGWICYQNGTKLSKGAGATYVKVNDQIVWKYTEDYTVDQ